MFHRRLPRRLYILHGLLGAFIVIFIWWLITFLHLVPPLFLPSPESVLQTTVHLLFHGELLGDILASLYRMLAGFMLATIVAIPLGLALGLSAKIEATLEPLIAFIRYIPPSAFIPIAILWLGVAEGEKVFIIFIGIMPYLALLVADAISRTRKESLEVAQTLGADRITLLTRVIVPPALPMIWDAMRVMMGAAWTFLIIVEIVGAQSGLGFFMVQSQRFVRTTNIFSAMLIVGLLGIITDYLFKLCYKAFFPWSEK